MFGLEPHLRVAFFPKFLQCLLTFMPSDGPRSLIVRLLLESTTFRLGTHPAGVERRYHWHHHRPITNDEQAGKKTKKQKNKKTKKQKNKKNHD